MMCDVQWEVAHIWHLSKSKGWVLPTIYQGKSRPRFTVSLQHPRCVILRLCCTLCHGSGQACTTQSRVTSSESLSPVSASLACGSTRTTR